jgi:hypothetical protein
MTATSDDQSPASSPEAPEPQGHVGPVPYDSRRPTLGRFKSRVWNKSDPRLFPPKMIGIGWAINFYWLFHLAGYFAGRRAAR